jgi:hypothetical protein
VLVVNPAIRELLDGKLCVNLPPNLLSLPLSVQLNAELRLVNLISQQLCHDICPVVSCAKKKKAKKTCEVSEFEDLPRSRLSIVGINAKSRTLLTNENIQRNET